MLANSYYAEEKIRRRHVKFNFFSDFVPCFVRLWAPQRPADQAEVNKGLEAPGAHHEDCAMEPVPSPMGARVL